MFRPFKSNSKEPLLNKTYNGGGNAYNMEKMPNSSDPYYEPPSAPPQLKPKQAAAPPVSYKGTDLPRVAKSQSMLKDLSVDNPRIQYHEGNFENTTLFNMHGSQSMALSFAEDESVFEKPPRAIEGSSGSRIRVVLGATGHSFLLACDEDDGDVTWQSKAWLNLPRTLDKKLREVEYVYQCSISPNNRDWFLTAKCGKTGVKKCFWNVANKQLCNALNSAIQGGLEVRVVFGDPMYGQYIVLLGPNGYTLGNNLPEKLLNHMDHAYDKESTIKRIRGLNAKGRYLLEEVVVEEGSGEDTESSDILRSVFHSNGLSPHLKNVLDDSVKKELATHEVAMGCVDLAWLAIFDESWTGSAGIHDDLASLLDAFYIRHRQRQESRNQEISIFKEQQRFREQQAALEAAEARRKGPFIERTRSDITYTIAAEAEKAYNRARQKEAKLAEEKLAEERAAEARAQWEAKAEALEAQKPSRAAGPVPDRENERTAEDSSRNKDKKLVRDIHHTDEPTDSSQSDTYGESKESNAKQDYDSEHCDDDESDLETAEERSVESQVNKSRRRSMGNADEVVSDDDESETDEISLIKSEAQSKTSNATHCQSVSRQRKRERNLGALQVAKRQSEKEDRLLEIQRKGFANGDRVLVLGLSTKAGDCKIEEIDRSEGVMRIRVPRKHKKKENHPKKSVVSIQDPHRVVKFSDHSAQFDNSELSMLAVSEDKYDAVSQVHHGHTESGTCSCKSVFVGFSQRALEQNLWQIGDKVHVVGYTDGTVVKKTRFEDKDYILHVRYEDGSSYHVCADKVRPIKRVISLDTCAFQQEKTTADEESLRIRQVFDMLSERSNPQRFDEFKCAEKIDVARLQSLVDDLRTDKDERRRLMHDLTECLDKDPENYKYDFCLRKLEICYELEEAANCLFDLLKGLRRDDEGCIVHQVAYKYRDEACRGRLFAVGHTIRVIEEGFPRSLTLQGVPHELRAVIAGAFSHYIDCENSDSRILCSLATQLGLDHLIPTLMDYKNYRDMWLDAILKEHSDCPISEIKRLPNVIMCGGTYNNWLQQVGAESVPKVMRFAFRLFAEVHALCDQIIWHPRFHWTTVERTKLEQKGLCGRFVDMLIFNRILQACEGEVLGIIHRSFHSQGWMVRAKIFDSILVEESSMSNKSLSEAIKSAEETCASFGWDVKIAEKPMFGLMDSEVKCVDDARAILNAVAKEIATKDTTSVLTEAS